MESLSLRRKSFRCFHLRISLTQPYFAMSLHFFLQLNPLSLSLFRCFRLSSKVFFRSQSGRKFGHFTSHVVLCHYSHSRDSLFSPRRFIWFVLHFLWVAAHIPCIDSRFEGQKRCIYLWMEGRRSKPLILTSVGFLDGLLFHVEKRRRRYPLSGTRTTLKLLVYFLRQQFLCEMCLRRRYSLFWQYYRTTEKLARLEEYISIEESLQRSQVSRWSRSLFMTRRHTFHNGLQVSEWKVHLRIISFLVHPPSLHRTCSLSSNISGCVQVVSGNEVCLVVVVVKILGCSRMNESIRLTLDSPEKDSSWLPFFIIMIQKKEEWSRTVKQKGEMESSYLPALLGICFDEKLQYEWRRIVSGVIQVPKEETVQPRRSQSNFSVVSLLSS